MTSPRVRINSASADELATLYDISRQRADRIVAHRKKHGTFNGPEDLAKVDGISLNLALALAPHIDWEIPPEPEQPKQREWSDALFWSIILLTLVLALVAIVLVFFASSTLSILFSGPGTWVKMLVLCSGVLTLLCFAFYSTTRLGKALVRSPKRARSLARLGLVSMGVAIILGVIMICSAVLYTQFYAPTGWSGLQTNQASWATLMGGVAFIFLLLLMGPQILVLWRPALATNRLIALIFDTGIVLVALALIGGIRVSTFILPLWVLVLAGVAGVIVIIVAAISFRRGESFFQASLDFIEPHVLTRQASTIDDWRMWINTRLPDAEQQRALKQALDEMYRPSPVKTFVGFLVLTLGGWLLLEVLGAIIEWYVQGWLNRL